ncbi:hypothetical protein [Sphingomonas jatrophae]|uniref:Membrane-bound lysozyme-inhibitor of c-type lysozyme n=1 Tax=Sphingomonas jatrophae TaxID=1166337 RepID=A0A1I6MA02_9SPHN|nr:hypothetical protein [Sphingomonas jatrophae]SFS12554.1 hypothetical protein SAMN05192580_3770 [Sphingomonas jatrophae]
MRPLILPCLLAAAACTTTPRPAASPGAAAEARSARYLCSDGRAVEILYGGDGSAVLTVGSETVELTPTAGGGWTGGGWRWRADGPAGGMLAHGTAAPTACRAGG